MKAFLPALMTVACTAPAFGQLAAHRPKLDEWNAAPPQIQRLEFASSYSSTPILCDSLPTHSETLRGTMVMSRVPASEPTTLLEFEINDVNWLLTPLGAQRVYDDVLITGKGVYRVVGAVDGKRMMAQQMELALWIGDEGPIVFDSGLTPFHLSTADVDICISEARRDLPAEVRSFHVVSSLVTRDEFGPYVMVDGATFRYLRAPDDELIEMPLDGCQWLVPLPIEPGTPEPALLSEWAVVSMCCQGVSEQGCMYGVGLEGSLIYQHFCPGIKDPPGERMQGALSINGPCEPLDTEPVRFDSGVLVGSAWAGGGWPSMLHMCIGDCDPAMPVWQIDMIAEPPHGPARGR